LYRKGDKINISNYGPILLLSLFSKVFEEVVYSRLVGHLNINKILVEEHFGFRKNLATEEAIMSMVGGIFCDLENAFDSVL